MIKIISGLPGAGKSLRAVQLICEEREKGRNVYVCGLDGLDPGLGCESIESPNDWQDLPDGSLIVIDEAQKWWPQRRSGDPAPHIRALSEHRHRGFDFIIITQHPVMIDKYVRTLCGEHQHVLRQFGANAAKLVTWGECYDDPQSQATRDRGTAALWRYPKDLFSRYKSATLHTVKARVPWRLKVIPALVVVATVLIYFAYASVSSLATSQPSETVDGALGGATIPASGVPSHGVTSAPPKYVDAASYAVAHTPRIAGKPWSMPIFDGAAPAARPELYCVSSETGRCICHTEQGTRYPIDRLTCHDMVANGSYNPYRIPPPTQGQVQGAEPDGSRRRDRGDDSLPGVRVRDVPKSPSQDAVVGVSSGR